MARFHWLSKLPWPTSPVESQWNLAIAFKKIDGLHPASSQRENSITYENIAIFFDISSDVFDKKFAGGLEKLSNFTVYFFCVSLYIFINFT